MSSFTDPPIWLPRSGGYDDDDRCDICGCELLRSEWYICEDCMRERDALHD